MIMTSEAVATEVTPPGGRPRRKRRVFMWTFLAIQALFLAWVLSVLFQGTGVSHADVVSMCGTPAHGTWQGLWKSYNDCAHHTGLVAAHDIGKSIALGMQIGLWVAADVILGIGRIVVVLARRGRTAAA
jgi:hypothetical protein